jgi:hypothetical protein
MFESFKNRYRYKVNKEKGHKIFLEKVEQSKMTSEDLFASTRQLTIKMLDPIASFISDLKEKNVSEEIIYSIIFSSTTEVIEFVSKTINVRPNEIAKTMVEALEHKHGKI